MFFTQNGYRKCKRQKHTKTNHEDFPSFQQPNSADFDPSHVVSTLRLREGTTRTMAFTIMRGPIMRGPQWSGATGRIGQEDLRTGFV